MIKLIRISSPALRFLSYHPLCRDFEVVTPFPVDKQTTEKVYTYLDTSGRPVLVIEKRNVLASDISGNLLTHHQDFQVMYRFRTLSMLQEPFLLMTAYFTLLLFVMLYVRVQFKIGPVSSITSYISFWVDG